MNLRHTLARNTAWYGGLTVVGLVSGLPMSVILARGLGPALMAPTR
jgi:O-antigen/teichoic acid export membrane protein